MALSFRKSVEGMSWTGSNHRPTKSLRLGSCLGRLAGLGLEDAPTACLYRPPTAWVTLSRLSLQSTGKRSGEAMYDACLIAFDEIACSSLHMTFTRGAKGEHHCQCTKPQMQIAMYWFREANLRTTPRRRRGWRSWRRCRSRGCSSSSDFLRFPRHFPPQVPKSILEPIRPQYDDRVPG